MVNAKQLQALVSGFSIETDRKSTRLNSSHLVISYAVFCLKKKKRILEYRSVSHVRLAADPPLDGLPVEETVPTVVPRITAWWTARAVFELLYHHVSSTAR